MTEYEDIEESIPEEVADTREEREEAMETIQESLQTDPDTYSIIIQTKKHRTDVLKLFHKFDDTTQIAFMYESEGQNFYEVFLKEDSIFRREMLEDIESGILPESFIGMQIVLPEVYTIEESSLSPNNSLRPSDTSPSIQGEETSKTWGIQEYQTYNYFSELQAYTSQNQATNSTHINPNTKITI